MQVIKIASGTNIIFDNYDRGIDWQNNLLARESMIAKAKRELCKSILATIERDIESLVSFEIDMETSEIFGQLHICFDNDKYQFKNGGLKEL